jgi:cysteinyl-tRNA synthetase
MDLIFPHHENEIAQSCGATGKEFARYWVHNGFVQINQEKMSKSLGNFFTIREIFEKSEWSEAVTGEMLRYFLLSTHYHGPLDFSDQAIKEAKNALNGFYDLFGRLAETGGNEQVDQGLGEAVDRCRAAFKAAMDDDFNTPMAIAALQALRSDVNKLLGVGLSSKGRQNARREFRSLGVVFGLFQLDRWDFNVRIEPKPAPLGITTSLTTVTVEQQITEEQIEAKLAERIDAKKRKDFKRADAIREELKSQGITIEDKPDGTSRWKR